MAEDILMRSGAYNPAEEQTEVLMAGREQLVAELKEAYRRCKEEGWLAPREMALAFVAGKHSVPPEHLDILSRIWDGLSSKEALGELDDRG